MEFLIIILFVDFYDLLYASTVVNEMSEKSSLSRTNDRSAGNFAHMQSATMRNL